jgi:tripartite-type tricarboxylate transporter receptor subunit TctC
MRRACHALIAVAALAAALPVAAQNFPDRPVRIVVGLPPGGGVDFVARVLAQKISESWPQTAVVDNRAGANGIIATEIVAKSKPDGYTLLIVNTSHAINPPLYPKMPYDSIADFTPISLLAQYPFLLITHPALPAHNLKEFIALAKAKPGQISFGSPGSSSAPHLGMEIFANLTGVKMLHVAYKGAGPAITDIIAGETQVMLLNLAPIQSLLKNGRLRALVVAGPTRPASLPNVPTAAESGLPGFSVLGWYALLAPAGMPAPLRTRIHDDFVKALHADDVEKRFAADNNEIIGNTPDELTAFLKKEMAQYAKVIRENNIKLD